MKCGPQLSLERIDLAPGSEWSPDCPGWCFLRVCNHCGYWLGNGRAIETGPGDVLALSPLREGCLRASQLGPVTVHHFRFSPDLAGGLLTPAEHEQFEQLAFNPDQAVRRFPADSDGAKIWSDLVSARAPGSELLRRTELLRIIARLLAAEMHQPAPACRPYLPARLKLRVLLNQMPEEEFLRLIPRDLAARCGVRTVQINRSFRQLLGQSIREHQASIRLRRARQALAETNGSLEAIAREAGFRDTRSFSAAFKKRFGIAPSGWRKPGRKS